MTHSTTDLKTPFYAMHLQSSARMVSFAGYAMPVQYQGVKAEHLHTREAAGLFDVSHMGQIIVTGDGACKSLERLMPADIAAMPIGRQCYSQLTLPQGGILDDLIVTRLGEQRFMLVVNASRKQHDLAHLSEHIADVEIVLREDMALLALQGPLANQVMTTTFSSQTDVIGRLRFMHAVELDLLGRRCVISRSGYTGEDGFEVSMPIDIATEFAELLLQHTSCSWVGLGARDSLRLEAGLCLYGHDIDETTSPVEAGLSWSVAKSRRNGGAKAGGFIGADIILPQLDSIVSYDQSSGGHVLPLRRRVGFVSEARAPIREGAKIVVERDGQVEIGAVTSGGFSPSLQRPILMAYVDNIEVAKREKCFALVRDKLQPLQNVSMPFVPHSYKR